MGYLDKEGLSHFWAEIKTRLSGKQDKLTGTAGQVVGFNASGQAVARPGIPTGGSTGGVLTKSSDTDYDTGWEPLSSIGAELIKATNPVGAALSQKVPILQTVPFINLLSSDMIDGLIDDGAIKLSKIGNIVTVNLNVRTATELNYNKVFAIIPEGYRPQATVTFPLCDSHGSALYGAIQENGECKTYNAATKGSFLSAAITYFVGYL